MFGVVHKENHGFAVFSTGGENGYVWVQSRVLWLASESEGAVPMWEERSMRYMRVYVTREQ